MPEITSKKFLYFSFFYTLFIIYGSLVPLDYRSIPFEDALLSFQQIRYLNLGATSRADWISNIVLYIPLTFSLAALLTSIVKKPVLYFFGSILILIFCISLAVTIEFYQQFFPPRTVSQNDLIAEAMGSVIGLVLWNIYGKRLQKLYSHILTGGRNALLASAILYAVGYLVLSFFPYDFITSLQELNTKLAKDSDAFFISSSCGGFIICSTKLLVEVVITLPLGIFLAALLRSDPHRRTAVMLAGFILGAIIEIIQLFILSGVAQGISVLTRVIGLGLGELLYTKASAIKKPVITVNIRKYLTFASIPYFLLLATLNGWSVSAESTAASITDNIDRINWLPFYYHYYTTEAVALTSLLSIFAMYLPIGLGVWLWSYNNRSSTNKIMAGLFAVIICVVMETGKIFFVGKHPDPTNLIISFVSASITYSLTELIYKWFHQSEIIERKQRTQPSAVTSKRKLRPAFSHSPGWQSSNHLGKVIAIIIFVILFWKTTSYPVSSLALISTLLLYSFILQKYSQAWLIVIPALLPIFDFAPWTGRFFFSEFDYFIVLTVAISLWNGRLCTPFKTIKPVTLILLALYILFYFISLLKGLLPLQAIDVNAFNNYYSQYNSLRVAKGAIWAFLLLPYLCYCYTKNLQQAKTFFAYGTLLGLSGVILTSLWERIIFTGLFDFSSDYRITSMFSSMHTGGGHIDIYLVTAIPFISVLFLNNKYNTLNTLLGIGLFLSSLYVLMVTFSRGPYIAFCIQFIVLTFTLYIARHKQQAPNRKKVLILPALVLLVPVIAIPVFQGDYIQQRFNQTNKDFDTRAAHWYDAIKMMDNNPITTLFGMGLGSYPRTYYLNNSENIIPATYSLRQENNSIFLRLWGGDPLYMEQKINIHPYSRYLIKADVRSSLANAALSIPLCEKGLLYSFNCRTQILSKESEKNRWVHIEQIVDIDSFNSDTGHYREDYSSLPIKIALYNSDKNAVIDVKNFSFLDSSNSNLISNGDFSNGLDHWFFSTDNHLPWHSKNIWVQVIFDQGWVGFFIFASLLIYAFAHQIKLLTNKDSYSAVLLTSLTGFIVVGAAASPFDAPRLTLLFFLILFFAFFSEQIIKPSHRFTTPRPRHTR